MDNEERERLWKGLSVEVGAMAERNTVGYWLALSEGARITYADFEGYYAPMFFWSAELRGKRVVECTFLPALCLPHLTC